MTDIIDYYEEEYRYLLEGGKEFAKLHPERARYLNLDDPRARDPHVERLLEAFAFLAGRIHKRLDDEFPEITHSLLTLIYPHYLCPIPSMSILEFLPIKGRLSTSQIIPRGTLVESEPVEGALSCQFQTCYDVKVYPISLAQASLLHDGGENSICLRFAIDEGVNLTDIGLDRIRIYLAGEPTVTYTIYQLLSWQVKEVILRGDRGDSRNRLILGPDRLQMVGFGQDEAILPYSDHAYPGYRLLEEYFVFPEKFLFVDICNLEALSELEVTSHFEIEIRLKAKVPAGLRLSSENFRLYYTPIVNIFPRDAEPIRLDHLNTKYRIIADLTRHQNFEIYSVSSVEGVNLNTGKRHRYQPFYSFTHRPEEDEGGYYYITRQTSPWGGWDTYISFVLLGKNDSLLDETVSLELMCTNADVVKRIEIGDICRPTQSVPGFVKFSNVTRPTPPLRPKLGREVEWDFISHLALNFLSITDVSALRRLLEIYDVGNNKANRHRIAGIVEVNASPKEILLHGSPIRGTHIRIRLNEKHFEGMGDIQLFSSILNEFISLYASINSFTQLTVDCAGSGVSLEWPPVVGKRGMM